MKRYSLLLVLHVALLASSCTPSPSDVTSCPASKTQDWPIDSAWLTREVTVDEADRFVSGEAELDLDRSDSLESVIADSMVSHYRRQWQPIRKQIREEDAVWIYSTQEEDFGSLSGRCGLVVVRDCQVVAEMTTARSL